MSNRALIVNADDLGWTPGVNEGIFEAHLRGVVTSATLMVNAPGAEHAAESLRRPELAELGVGLHFTLTGGGRPTLPPEKISSLVDERGCLPRRPEGLSDAREDDILAEARAQLERFAELVGRAPTHLDGHHHAHRLAEVRAAVLPLAARRSLPVRAFDSGMRDELRRAGIATPVVFHDSFYAEGVTRENLGELVDAVAAGEDGAHEIMCHPGHVDDGLASSSTYVADRETEVKLLTEPALAARIAAAGIRLVSYSIFGEPTR